METGEVASSGIWILDDLWLSCAEGLVGEAWAKGAPTAESIELTLLLRSESVERLRGRGAAGVVEFDLDLGALQPHQFPSARLQCAIAASLVGQSGLLVHGAGLTLSDRGGVVALAPSGGGKSTLSDLATSFTGLSDETILLRPGPPAQISATPLRSSSDKTPQRRTDLLKALLFLEKNPVPSFTRIAPHAALPLLLAQAYKLPVELATTAHLFKRASQLVENVPAYRFAFPKSPEAEALLLRLFDEELDPKQP